MCSAADSLFVCAPRCAVPLHFQGDLYVSALTLVGFPQHAFFVFFFTVRFILVQYMLVLFGLFIEFLM